MNATAPKKQGLGKGLSALMGNNPLPAKPGTPGAMPIRTAVAELVEEVAAASSGIAAQGLRQIDVQHIAPGKFQPRRNFAEEQLAELADSIEKHGVMQPIVLREIAAQQFEIIAGERRWRASKLVGLKTIPAIVRELSDSEALELALIENIQREDLNPLEEAEGYVRLIEEFHYTQENLSKVVGKSRSHIANLLRLLKLPEGVKKYIDSGELSMGHARAILGATDPEAVAARVVAEGLSVRQAEKLAKGESLDAIAQHIDPARGPAGRSPMSHGESFGGDSGSARGKTEDVLQLENMLSDNLGLKVSINTRGGQAGEVVISYDSLGQLDDILRRLGGGI